MKKNFPLPGKYLSDFTVITDQFWTHELDANTIFGLSFSHSLDREAFVLLSVRSLDSDVFMIKALSLLLSDPGDAEGTAAAVALFLFAFRVCLHVCLCLTHPFR